MNDEKAGGSLTSSIWAGKEVEMCRWGGWLIFPGGGFLCSEELDLLLVLPPLWSLSPPPICGTLGLLPFPSPRDSFKM